MVASDARVRAQPDGNRATCGPPPSRARPAQRRRGPAPSPAPPLPRAWPRPSLEPGPTPPPPALSVSALRYISNNVFVFKKSTFKKKIIITIIPFVPWQSRRRAVPLHGPGRMVQQGPRPPGAPLGGAWHWWHWGAQHVPSPSVHELGVPLRPGDNNVHPDAHGLGRGRHHVVEAVVGLDAEGERRVGALGSRGGRVGAPAFPPLTPSKLSTEVLPSARWAAGGIRDHGPCWEHPPDQLPPARMAKGDARGSQRAARQP